MNTCLKKKKKKLGTIYLHENVICSMCFFPAQKARTKKKKKKKSNVYSHAMTNMHGILCCQILYNKKMRMHIKHNIYFKNPKFAKEVTHSKSIIRKQETRVKFEFLFFSN